MSVVMNLFAATNEFLIFCGRHKLHVHNLNRTSEESEVCSLDLVSLLSDSEKLQTTNISAVCCALSLCSTYALVADSEKNVFMFLVENYNWRHHCSWKMDKRIIKVQFDKYSSTIILTDKTGDVYVCFFENMTVSSPKKILGHCSLILDTIVTEDNTEIYTCDRDEKIRVSVFPNAYEINKFLLGHREAVVNIAFAKKDKLLLSASCDGMLNVWSREDGNCVATRNIFEILHGSGIPQLHNLELVRMRATDNSFNTGYLAIIISKCPQIYIFRLNFETLELIQFGEVKKSSDFCDATWVNQNLYVYNPEIAQVEVYVCNETAIVPESVLQCLQSDSDVKSDIVGYSTFHKNYVSLKKLAWVDKSKPVDYESNKYEVAKLNRL